jgi:hypothetical protein
MRVRKGEKLDWPGLILLFLIFLFFTLVAIADIETARMNTHNSVSIK